MAILKYFEIRDRGTFIPALAIKPIPATEKQRWLLARSGYGTNPSNWHGVILVKLQTGQCSYDPYNWGDGSRTMTVAHDYIAKKFGELPDGSVVDVEFLLGEKLVQKESEMFTTGVSYEKLTAQTNG